MTWVECPSPEKLQEYSSNKIGLVSPVSELWLLCDPNSNQSLDHLGDDDHIVAFLRRIAEGVFDGKAGAGDIIGPHIVNRERVRGGLHARHIDFPEFLDVGEHVGELRGELDLFLRRKREAREVRDAVDIEIFVGSHGVWMND